MPEPVCVWGHRCSTPDVEPSNLPREGASGSLLEKLAKLRFFSSFRRQHRKEFIIFLLRAGQAFFNTPKLCVLCRGGRERKGHNCWHPVQGVRAEGPGVFTWVQMCQASFLGFLYVSCLISQHFSQASQEMSEVLSRFSPFLWAYQKRGLLHSLPDGSWRLFCPWAPQSWGACNVAPYSIGLTFRLLVFDTLISCAVITPDAEWTQAAYIRNDVCSWLSSYISVWSHLRSVEMPRGPFPLRTR